MECVFFHLDIQYFRFLLSRSSKRILIWCACGTKAQFRRRASAVPNLIVILCDCSTAGK